MRKTFYTVKCGVMGADNLWIAYFDNKESAYEFYNDGEFRDKPVPHTVSDPKVIKEYQDQVNGTKLYFLLNN